ncbi:MAG: hypothetical protein AVDCRST_MAG28-584 [uncultured Rubrobacteraceae bacterium]|uniref:Uncharacterized protein n=1 Tax=uncultured Rubrobacteraceae bacterium TaxID=349277 RepID=A0A6J4QHV1_9ACTN|nr:MAG: hypothetical protein AVDCRST_MAG28-584 [uncultured Rubrobacteraceae bacterium]
MTPRTVAPPLDDPRMWRKLLGRCHPDAGGSGELFIFAGAVRDVVCGGELRIEPKPEPTGKPSRRREPSTDDKPRIPFPADADFEELTHRALCKAAEPGPYAAVLSLLADCYPLPNLVHEEVRGASYKRLAAIAYAHGMSPKERSGFYRCAESIPLSDRHAGHILSKLKRQAA